MLNGSHLTLKRYGSVTSPAQGTKVGNFVTDEKVVDIKSMCCGQKVCSLAVFMCKIIIIWLQTADIISNRF